MALHLLVLNKFAIICMKNQNMAEYLVLHNHSMIYAFCSMHSHDRMCWPRIELRVSNFGKLDEKNLEHVIVPAFPNPSLSLSLSSNLFPKYALSNNHLFPYPAPMHSQASFKIKNHHDHYLSQRASKCIQFHSIFRSISEHPFRGTEIRFLRIQRKRGLVTRTVGRYLIFPQLKKQVIFTNLPYSAQILIAAFPGRCISWDFVGYSVRKAKVTIAKW